MRSDRESESVILSQNPPKSYIIPGYTQPLMPRSKKPTEPKLFLPLTALSVVLIILGMIEVASMTSAATYLPANYRNPKSNGHDLFNVQEFRTLRRARVDSYASTSSSSETISVSSPASSSAVSSISSAAHAAAEELTWNDLTISQRETMRRQLRVYTCPQDTDPAYKALCEKLLKAQGANPTRTGTKNPRQP